MSELFKRVVVAVILIPIAFVIVIVGGIYFFVAIALISTLVLQEFYKMSEQKGYSPSIILSLIFNFIVLLRFYFTTQNIDSFVLSSDLLMLIFPTLVLLQQLFSKNTNIYANVGTSFAGLLYITIPMVLLILIRFQMSIPDVNSAYFILMIFCSIWICDSAAYFVGKKFGKRKLLASVSPKKTVAGAVGGFSASLLFFPIASNFVLPTFPVLYACIIGATIGILGQIGDLVESKFKRDANIKDSGNLIPGHGGVLDRFDSIIFTIPIVYVLLSVFY
ncbi:MAG: phosphatidate cytidylyltransferase [Ignavibacteria bacterium]|jgi:phosphatidate cytidylyltransferase|nr:phosphatidate cytidylyltransferase [Ignavibacteria bacterium]